MKLPILEEMYIYETVDKHRESNGYVSLNVTFEDRPSRVYVGAMHCDSNRFQVAQMLHELAMRIEYDVVGEAH
jgi:hypothetical protein